MEWLKVLLDAFKAKLGETEGGDALAGSVDGLQKQIQTEMAKHFVPKDEFNTKSTELKEANKTIKALKDANTDNDGLQQKIEQYEADVKQLNDENARLKKEYTLKDALKEIGCKDPDYLIYKEGGIDKIAFDKDGNADIDALSAKYKESAAYIFDDGDKLTLNGAKPHERGTDPADVDHESDDDGSAGKEYAEQYNELFSIS